jgi:hypothetical protein
MRLEQRWEASEALQLLVSLRVQSDTGKDSGQVRGLEAAEVGC